MNNPSRYLSFSKVYTGKGNFAGSQINEEYLILQEKTWLPLSVEEEVDRDGLRAKITVPLSTF
jgi:hypothetical protein